MSKVIDLSSENFQKEVLESKIPVLVDFWAPWCGPCRMMAPVLEDLAGEFDGQVQVAKIDVENPANQALAAQYQIMSIPNMKLFKNGQVIGELVGFRPKEELKKELQKQLGI